jgi:CDP-diacylglycerol--glycerol-3-phosphate 3-phosphatidyltransferase
MMKDGKAIYDGVMLPLVKLFPRAVRPNHLTAFRLICTPFVALAFLWGEIAIGMMLFAFAALSDLLDGTMARYRNQITAWGVFFDPFADKFLILVTLLTFIIRFVPSVLIVLILIMEMSVFFGGLTRRAFTKKAFASANNWGKAKATLEVAGVISVFLFAAVPGGGIFLLVGSLLLAASIPFGIVSMATYSL